MANMLLELLQTTVALFAAAFLLGLVFDRTEEGHIRNAAIGFVCSVFATILWMVATTTEHGALWAAAAPLFLIAGLFGGLLGAAIAVALPLKFMIALPPEATLSIAGAFVALGATGAIARWLSERWGMWPRRSAVVVASVMSPFALVTLSMPGAGAEPSSATVFALAAWVPLATTIFGLMVHNEFSRSETATRQQSEQRFERNTGHVSRVFFENQLNHHYHLSIRYGVAFAYLLVSVDDGINRRKAYGQARTRDVTEELACAIRASVRDSDVCAMVDVDRFAVLLPHTTLGSVGPVVDRIQRLARGNVEWAEGVPATVSIGAADSVEVAAPGDVENSAEGALFSANARQPSDAVGPANLEPMDGVIRSFPGKNIMDAPPAPAPLTAVQSPEAMAAKNNAA